MPKRKIKETGFLSNSERKLLQRLYTHGPTAYGSKLSLLKESKLPIEKVEYFLQQKPAYTKFTSATRKFPRLSAYARHIDDIWCIDLAYVDKLASDNQNVKYLMVAVDIFSRFVRVQPMKSKDANEAKAAFLRMVKFTQPKRIWTDQGKEFEGDFKSFCKIIDVKIYHTHSETKAAYAERAIRSLKNIIYRFIEDTGSDKYVHKLQDFAKTMNSRTNRSIGKPPNKVKNDDVLDLLYKNTKPKQRGKRLCVGDFVRISKENIPFRKGYKPQFTDEVFKVVGFSTIKPVITYKIKDSNGEVILGKFYRKELQKVVI